MNSPPKYLGSTKVLEFTPIDDRHQTLAAAKLEVAGMVSGPARYLAICLDESEQGYYLYFCDEHWNIWNDLWFAEIQDAKDYVESDEYSGTSSTWSPLT